MQQDGKIIIQAPRSKKILFGALAVLGLAAIVVSVVLIVTGPTEDIFRRVAWLLFGLVATIQIWMFFVHASTRLTFDGNTLQTTGLGSKTSIFNFASLQRIQPVKASSAAWGNRPTGLLFTDASGGTFSMNAFSLGALSKKGRQQLLHILEPFILKEGMVQENDKTDVQRVLSGFTPDAPIRLTADAEAFAVKARRLMKFVKVIMIVGLLPLTIFILLIIASTIFTTITCDKLLAEGKETTAQITTLDVKRNAANEISTLQLDLTYSIGGQTYNKEFRVYSLDSKAVYDKIKNASSVQIRYLPDSPETIKLASEFSDGTAQQCKF